MQYDNTVRNSERTIVQFSYGDDGLNPEYMENNSRPVDFHRLRKNICSDFQDLGSENLTKDKLSELVEKELSNSSWQALVPDWVQDLPKTNAEVSERSERALMKTRIRATTKLTLFSIFWLARLPLLH